MNQKNEDTQPAEAHLRNQSVQFVRLRLLCRAVAEPPSDTPWHTPVRCVRALAAIESVLPSSQPSSLRDAHPPPPRRRLDARAHTSHVRQPNRGNQHRETPPPRSSLRDRGCSTRRRSRCGVWPVSPTKQRTCFQSGTIGQPKAWTPIRSRYVSDDRNCAACCGLSIERYAIFPTSRARCLGSRPSSPL